MYLKIYYRNMYHSLQPTTKVLPKDGAIGAETCTSSRVLKYV
jgi:hypothetical protein